VRFDQAGDQQVTLTATDDDDQVPGNDTATATVAVLPGTTDVELVNKFTNAVGPWPTGVFEFFIVVRNNGSLPAADVVVEDLLPPGMTLVDAGYALGGSQTFAPCGLPCVIGPLPAGTLATVFVRVNVSEPGTYTNTGRVTAANDGTPANNEGQATLEVVATRPNLRLRFFGEPSTVTAGARVSINGTLENTGGTARQAVVAFFCAGQCRVESVALPGYECATAQGGLGLTCRVEPWLASSTSDFSVSLRALGPGLAVLLGAGATPGQADADPRDNADVAPMLVRRQ
jgi:uncharacterized repeat protein (TIGR01451 family)